MIFEPTLKLALFLVRFIVKLLNMKSTALPASLFFVLVTNLAIAQPPGHLAIHSYATRAGNGSPAKAKYSIDQFTGRWQEISRMKSGSKDRVEVVDTIYLHFYDNGTADTKEGDYGVMNGTTEVFTDNYLTTSAVDFRIVRVSSNVIVLDDLTGYLHTLKRVNKFSYEDVPPLPPPVLDTSANSIDLGGSSVMKNWFAYRRAANPGSVDPQTPLLRYVRIKEKSSNNNYKGEVEFAKEGMAYVQPATISFNDRNITIETEGNSWTMRVYKANGKEMIIGKRGVLVYYFKNLD